ncbi:MAG: C39 family peptidase [Candidatus Doudnabacteria bacterium]|nr:C39 family peptidase [Candidatus Doudnabacteria bacterium]
MKKSLGSSNKILVGLVIVALAITAVVFFDRTRTPEEIAPTDTTQNTKPTPTPSTNSDKENPTSSTIIKDKVVLSVPFTPQAPTANWDELHNEACEEASIIMAAAYFNGDTAKTLSAESVESQISSLTEYQTEEFGYYLSINTAETKQMIEDNYNVAATIIKNFDEDDLKRALSEGKPIILPVNGRMLENPNFKVPGPIYHMLVIIGYDDKGFITNDPGTRLGRQYRYSYETLYNATGEWEPSGHTTNTNIKQAIIVSK